MAEDLLVTGVGEILKELGSVIASEIAQASDVKDEMRKLQRTAAMISGLLEDAEKRQVEETRVRLWLKSLKEVAYDASDVLDEFAYEALRHKVKIQNSMINKKVRNFFTPSIPLVFRFKMAHKIKEINKRLDEINKDKRRLDFKEATESSKSVEIIARNRETSSVVVDSDIVGRKDDRSEIVKMLTSSENQPEILSVIPIVGMAGLGKTTLAQSVYNDMVVKEHFHTRIWVCISVDFDVKRILSLMMESLEGNRCDNTLSLDVMSRKLRDKIGGKRFLLVLDDVWNDDDRGKWDTLEASLKIGASGSKVIVTTRSTKVALIMSTHIHRLQVLSEDESWCLFKRRAFESGGVKETPNLVRIGREIVNKCGGLPLAIKALGGLLRSEEDERKWLSIQESDLWTVERTDILPALQLSYDRLPSHVKQCFSYCSLFPKDFEIEKQSLIRQWAAHGFIQQLEGSGLLMEDIGDMYFNILLWNSFFQDVEKDKDGNITRCKMHDLVHDLALSISSYEYSTVYGNHQVVGDVSQVRHLSFIYFEEETFPEPLFKAEKLRTFISSEWSRLIVFDKRSLINMFKYFKCLHVLDLNCSAIEELPSSIGELKHLRYLDLSSTNIEVLPDSITSLYNLQTLILGGSELRELPRNMRKLISLRHLEYDDMEEAMPITKIGQLTNLQTLSSYFVGKSKGCGIKELGSLKNLRGHLRIYGLANVRNGMEAEEANLKGKPNIESLFLSWGARIRSERVFYHDNDGDVLKWLQPPQNLKRLEIREFDGMEFPTSTTGASLLPPKLVEIKLCKLKRCQSLPALGHLRFLKVLEIQDCPALESMPSVGELLSLRSLTIDGCKLLRSLPDGLKYLTALERLDVGGLYDEMEFPTSTTGASLLPPNLVEIKLYNFKRCQSLPALGNLRFLKVLEIRDCPALESVPSVGELLSLRLLTIKGCKLLRSLPDGLKYLTALESLDVGGLYDELDSFSNAEDLQHLSSLRTLEIQGWPKLNSLPHQLQYLTKLEELIIWSFENLVSLPEWMGNLVSLQELSINYCPKMKYLPSEEALSRLTALRSLGVFNSPLLKERCTENTGEEWHKISRIPHKIIR